MAGTINVICKRSVMFVDMVTPDPEKPYVVMPTGKRVIIPVNPAPQLIPDWVKNNLAYQDCVKFGVITEVIIPGQKKAAPPPEEEEKEPEPTTQHKKK